jgi:PAS domain S-box-containing protein
MSFRRRAALGLTAAGFLVLLLTLLAFFSLRSANRFHRQELEQERKVVEIGSLGRAFEREVASARGYLLERDGRFLSEAAESRGEFLRALRQLRLLATDASEIRETERIARAEEQHNEAIGRAIAMAQEGAPADSVVRFWEAQVASKRTAFDRAVSSFLAEERGVREALRRQREARSGRLGAVVLAGGLTALLLTVVLAVVSSRRLTQLFDQERAERSRAEEALFLLQRSERRQGTIADSALDAIVTMDARGRILEFNSAAQGIFGYRAEEAVGKEMAQLLIPARLRDQHRRGLSRYLEAGEGPILGRRLEMPALRADGTEFPVELSVARVPGNGPPVFTGFVRDISARKRAEQTLRESEERFRSMGVDITEMRRAAEERATLLEEARAAVRARDQLLSVASHELKTPVATLRLQLQALLRETGDPKEGAAGRVASRLATAERQISRLTRLIDELLDVSRITSGRLRLDLEELDLPLLVRDAVARLGEQITRAGCRVEIRGAAVSRGLWDRFRLEQVVTNLLSNAVQYGAGKPIEITVDGDERAARLTIRDHGIGIPSAHQSRIFERFERAVSERHYGGLGLELWIARQIVEALGGSIAVESEPEKGSTFVVTLPRASPGIGLT